MSDHDQHQQQELHPQEHEHEHEHDQEQDHDTDTTPKKAKQGSGKRLNDNQRVEIIQIAENSKISKRQLAEKFGVSEAAIRKLLLKKDEVLKRYYETPEELRGLRLRGKSVRYGNAAQGLTRPRPWRPLTTARRRRPATRLGSPRTCTATARACTLPTTRGSTD